MGAVAIVCGAIVIGFDPNRWDAVLMNLPRGGHGIHVTDVVGMALVVLGIAVLWVSPHPS